MLRIALLLVPRDWRAAVEADLTCEAERRGSGRLWMAWQAARVGLRYRLVVRRGVWIVEIARAARSLRRSPAYALSVAGVLSVGLALVATTLAVADGVLFKPLPYANPSELYYVELDRRDLGFNRLPHGVSGLEFAAWLDAIPVAFPAWLFGLTGTAALALLGVGVLGQAWISVTRRTREFGIRIALGATSGQVYRRLLATQLRSVAAGLTCGAVASYWAIASLDAHLYRPEEYRVSVGLTAVAAVALIATLGAALPARRVTRVDPVTVLRAP